MYTIDYTYVVYLYTIDGNEIYFRKPNPSMIRWVLTVPAIWRDESKQFMREVAHRVNIKTIELHV